MSTDSRTPFPPGVRLPTLFPGEQITTGADIQKNGAVLLVPNADSDWDELIAQREAELRAISRLLKPRRRMPSGMRRKVVMKTARGLKYRAVGK